MYVQDPQVAVRVTRCSPDGSNNSVRVSRGVTVSPLHVRAATAGIQIHESFAFEAVVLNASWHRRTSRCEFYTAGKNTGNVGFYRNTTSHALKTGFESHQVENIFTSPKRPGQLWGTTSLLFNAWRDSSPRVKRPERDINHSVQIVPRLRMSGVYFSSVWLHGEDGQLYV
jgi:hypothetical protein